MRRSATILGLTAILLATTASRGWSQQFIPCRPISPCQQPTPPSQTPRWQGHALALSINMALGALSAGIVRAAQGESFLDAFYQGGAGGGVAYLGKYISVQQAPGVALLGRQTAALGASITRSAITGSGAFERLAFPLGPFRIHRSAAGTRLTMDLPTVAGTIYGLSRPGARFDLGRSLATGALVFEVESIRRERSNQQIVGMAIGGTILFRPDPRFLISNAEIMAHEVIHVLQHDFMATALSSPFEEWLTAKLPGPFAGGLQYLDLGAHLALRAVPAMLGTESRNAPWEREAYFLVP